MLKFNPVILCGLMLFALLAPTVHAADTTMPKYSQTFDFYEIGGGTKLHMRGGVLTPLSLGTKFGANFSCGKFDVNFAIEQTLNALKQRLVNLSTQVQASVAALPGYIICRAVPQLCQLMQNYTVRAEGLIGNALKSCQQMDADLMAGRDPLDGWLKLGRGFNLRLAGSKSGDIYSVMEEAKAYDPAKQGVPWGVGGKPSGGDGMPSIRPLSDTVRAGYNVMLGRNLKDGSAASGDDPLINIFPTPEHAAKWTAEVVGEFRPDINGGGATAPKSGATSGKDDGDGGKGGEDTEVTAAWLAGDSSTPGLGLAPKIEKEHKLVVEKLTEMVNRYKDTSQPAPTAEEMSNLGGKSGSIKITPGLLSMISKSAIPEFQIAQLSWNIAVINVTLYALEAKRLMMAGLAVPDFAVITTSNDQIEKAIERMGKELAEIEYQQRFYSGAHNVSAMKMLAGQKRAYDRSGASFRSGPGSDSNPFR
jgi:integrating conjugative element protein (TIGR03755 family)